MGVHQGNYSTNSENPCFAIQRPPRHLPTRCSYSFCVSTLSVFLRTKPLGRQIRRRYPALKVLVGTEYLIAGDILISRKGLAKSFINLNQELVSDLAGSASDLCSDGAPLLHASVSCKWTLRSDRAQNARSEALNLIRNRKGRAPHIALVTAEPTPARLGSLALGTGDIDCVYHIALPELIKSVEMFVHAGATENVKKNRTILLQQLWTMINGRRLKDISDLPLDLAT